MKKFAFLIWISAMLSSSGCVSESPSLMGIVRVDPSEYQNMLINLDEETRKFKMQRKSAGPGLDQLIGRKVLFHTYVMNDTSKRPFLVTDVKEEGMVEFHIYGQDFKNKKEYEIFVESMFAIFAEYGDIVEVCSPDSQCCN